MSKKIPSNRRFLSFVLSVSMIFALAPGNAFAAIPTDIEHHWAKNEIVSFMDQDLIKGYPDGTIRPNNNITRAEFMNLLNNALGFKAVSEISFKDVKKGAWYANDIAKAISAGYITGFSDGTVRPNALISREESAAILMQIEKLTANENGASKFTDELKMKWSKGAIGAVAANNIMRGYPNGTFKPQNYLKRAEAVITIQKAVAYFASLTQIEPEVIPSTPAAPVVIGGGSGGGGNGGGNTLQDQGAPTGLLGVAPTTFGVSDGKITGTTTEMEYRLLADQTWTAVTGTEIIGLPAGYYDVRYAAKTGFNSGTAATVTVGVGANLDQAAPTTLVGVAPTTFGVSDGKIIGTTTDMEYRKLVDGTSFESVTGTEITGLAAGSYDVRYAAKTGFNVGTEATIIVPVVANKDQAAPTGLGVVAPTTFGGNDGKITGTTTDMAYRRLVEGTSFEPVTGAAITGLVAGYYDVIYLAKEGYNQSLATGVQIKEAEASLKALTINGIAVIVFAAGTYTYDTVLLAGTTKVPTVVATATDSNATAVVSPAESLPGFTTVLVTAQDGIKTQTYTINFILTNAEPIGLIGFAPTTSAGNDGKITGTTTEMEYKISSADDSAYVICSGIEITGLKSGTYNVRYVAKPGFKIGASANVIVPNHASGKLLFTFDDGWKDTIEEAYPILDVAGFEGTVYVNRDMTQSAEYGFGGGINIPKFMNYNDLHLLYNDGWDISNHTSNHLDYLRNAAGQLVNKDYSLVTWQTPELYGAAHPTLKPDEWYDQWIKTLYAVGSDPLAVETILRPIYLENQTWLSSAGLDGMGKTINGVWTLGSCLNMPRSAYHVAYPSGLYSTELINMLKGNGVLTGRATIEDQANSNNYIFVPANKDFFQLPVQYVETELDANGNDKNLVNVLASIDFAVANGLTIILMIHRVGPVGDLFVTPKSLQEIVNHAKGLRDVGKLDVMTISQWYNTMK